MKKIAESYGKVSVDNLEEIFNKCTEIYRQYVIALGDDAQKGKSSQIEINNSVGDVLDIYTASGEIQKLKELNSNFTKILRNWTSIVINVITVQKDGFQPLKYFVLKKITKILD